MTEREWREEFSEKLWKLMEEHNISQRQLAIILDISNASVCRYLSGVRTPSGYLVSKICGYFN